MATGWAREGAVQEQIDDTVKDGVARAKSKIPQGPSATHCEDCGEPIPEARREALVECVCASNVSRTSMRRRAYSAGTTAAAAKTASCADGRA